MNRPVVAHLLDDFSMGGVSKGLSVFASGSAAEVADHRVVQSGGRGWLAPNLDVDIAVTHFPPNWRRLAWLASLRLRNPGLRIVHVEHSYTRSFEATRIQNVARFRTMLFLASRLFDRIVCVSAAQADWLAEAIRADRRNLAVIHPYSDNDGLERLPLPQRAPQQPLRLVAYGRYSPEKRFDRLIVAMRNGLFGDAQLQLAGAGSEERRLRALAGDDPRITVGGRCDHIATLLAASDAVLIPSNSEAYGQVANEARQAGRPILVAATDGLIEQVGSAGIVVDFDRDDDIRAAIAALTPDACRAMGKAGRRATAGCGAQRRQQWAQLFLEELAQASRRSMDRKKMPSPTSAGQMM